MSLLRGLLVLCALLLGCAIAVALLPAAWVAPQLSARTTGKLALTETQGTLLRGRGQLRVPEIALAAPIEWRYEAPFSVLISVGGGALIVAPNSAAVRAPISIPIRHALARTSVTLAQEGRVWREAGQIKAQLKLTAPQLEVTAPTLQARFTNLAATLEPNGGIEASASGDATAKVTGALIALVPLRGDLALSVIPNAAANPALEAGVRRIFTPAGDNRFTYAYSVQ